MVSTEGWGGCLIISHTRVHIVYYDNSALFSSTKSQIYDKDKRGQLKVIILHFYKCQTFFVPLRACMCHKQSVLHP